MGPVLLAFIFWHLTGLQFCGGRPPQTVPKDVQNQLHPGYIKNNIFDKARDGSKSGYPYRTTGEINPEISMDPQHGVMDTQDSGDVMSPGMTEQVDLQLDHTQTNDINDVLHSTPGQPSLQYTHTVEDIGSTPSKDTEESLNTPPKYMVDLYDRFSTDRYSHPMANIVRSFVNMNSDTTPSTEHTENKTRVHKLMFNFTSVSRDEDIYLAELRLYTLIEQDRNRYYGVDRLVSVNQIYADEYGNETHYELISSKHIYGRHSGWETFTVTEALKKWVKIRTTLQVLEVRIETVFETFEDGTMDIDIGPHKETEPLLVVFSNDKKKKKSESRELHELLAHELDGLIPEDFDEEDIEYDDDYDYDKDIVVKRDTYHQKSLDREISIYESLNKTRHHGSFSTENRKKAALAEMYKQIMNIETEDGENKNNRRKRAKKMKKKKRRRNICRKRPMYVNFEDIHWDNWIIAPRGYQAFECTGRCYFPLSDHLTPTKHAIIQTLLHTNHPNKAARACCVPTKLDPISILYVDKKEVVTYKYKYDGMVVAECGCR